MDVGFDGDQDGLIEVGDGLAGGLDRRSDVAGGTDDDEHRCPGGIDGYR